MSDPERRLIAYELHQAADMPVTPAETDRAWMDASHQRAPYRCLPLVIANQAGWWLPCPATFTAYWDGGLGKESVQLNFDPPPQTTKLSDLFAPITVSADMPSPAVQADPRITSHFGSGIVTFSIPYLFRTPRGLNLWVKGPTNYIKDGVHPLEGIVETDWLPATFTMNWKLTRPYHTVRFERGEPICMIVPVPRSLSEQMQPVYVPLDANPELAHEYREWERSRDAFNRDLGLLKSEAVQRGWQRDYMKGRTVSGQQAQEHQTRLNLREFTRGGVNGQNSSEPEA
ncbi:MAG TPA: DUF6065 family protein [Gemmataceae bacterium]|nr:DUF6065 family protein [Gemmataceae bacterium]